MTSIHQINSSIINSVEYKTVVKGSIPPKIVLKYILERMREYNVFVSSVTVEKGDKRTHIEFHSMDVELTSNDYDGLMKILKIIESVCNVTRSVDSARVELWRVYDEVKYHDRDVNELIKKYVEAKKLYEEARSLGYRDEYMESLLMKVEKLLESRNINISTYDEKNVDEYTRWGE